MEGHISGQQTSLNFKNLIAEETGSGSTAAEEVLSPARHQGTHTALLRGHWADGAAHGATSTPESTAGHRHRDTQQKSFCPQGYWMAVPSLTTLRPLLLPSLEVHPRSLLGSSIKSPHFKEALQPSPQLQCLAVPQSCTNPSQNLATPAKGNRDLVTFYLT